MSKNCKFILIVIIVLIALGIIYMLSAPKSDKEEPQITPTPEVVNYPEGLAYTGKYSKEDKEIFVFQINNNEIYYVISIEVYGKASISNGEAESVAGGINYKMIFNGNNVEVTSSDETYSGTYIKESGITYEEFFNTNYGNIKYLNSKYNGKYSNDELEISIYQISENIVVCFISDLDGSKVSMGLNIDAENKITNTYYNDDYEITVEDNKIVFARVNEEVESNNFKKELTFTNKLTGNDIFDLYVEYWYS